MKHAAIVYEALIRTNDKIMHKTEILNVFKDYNSKFHATLNFVTLMKYLARHSFIKRIFVEYYYINSYDEKIRKYCMYEDKELFFLVLNRLEIQWYVGLSYALYLGKKALQVPNRISIINTKYSGEREILGLKVSFNKSVSMDGCNTRQTKNGIQFYYSNMARTKKDLAHFRKRNMQ